MNYNHGKRYIYWIGLVAYIADDRLTIKGSKWNYEMSGYNCLGLNYLLLIIVNNFYKFLYIDDKIFNENVFNL